MKGLIIVLGLLLCIVSIFGGLIGTVYWYDYDVEKCDSLKENDYYYTENNCYTTYNAPIYTQISMFSVLMIIPFNIIVLMIIVGIGMEMFRTW